MNEVQESGEGVWLKGVFWTKDEFITAVREAQAVHGVVNNSRLAFHFGVSEKAVRDLRKRSAVAEQVLSGESLSSGNAGKPKKYSERTFEFMLPRNKEVAQVLRAAEDERWRQSQLRRTTRGMRSARSRGADTERRQKERRRIHSKIQSCRVDGMTQAETAEHTGCSLSTVKRYWPEKISLCTVRKRRTRLPDKSEDVLTRRLIKQYGRGEISALDVAQSMEAEGLCVPSLLLELVQLELQR
ncbi:hypothetical protein [Lelliottia wanjuensis]|uniref:hypothetical protein n=1 Tax=Lelliottia wanjuensis TaxID=3050585 RepID=UPI00254AD043|nr:hypothetical protein [Lelliottia sp. V104_15]MDK9605522.1 hypothetical protein [Lelliottia sp. V104_15]